MGNLLLWLSLFWKNFCDCMRLDHKDVWIVSFLKGFPINYLKFVAFTGLIYAYSVSKPTKSLADQMEG